MVMGNFTNEAQEMLAEGGFEPCFIRDIAEGDTIAIDHDVNRDVPTEMTVTGLWEVYGSDNVVRKWIGVLPNGRKVHCSYGYAYPVWRQAPVDESDE